MEKVCSIVVVLECCILTSAQIGNLVLQTKPATLMLSALYIKVGLFASVENEMLNY